MCPALPATPPTHPPRPGPDIAPPLEARWPCPLPPLSLLLCILALTSCGPVRVLKELTVPLFSSLSPLVYWESLFSIPVPSKSSSTDVALKCLLAVHLSDCPHVPLTLCGDREGLKKTVPHDAPHYIYPHLLQVVNPFEVYL